MMPKAGLAWGPGMSQDRPEAMMPSIDVDTLVNCPEWQEAMPEAQEVCRQAVTAACHIAGSDLACSEVSVVLTDDDDIRKLNSAYRGKDEATNVLAFPAMTASERPLPHQPRLLGDVVVAFETTATEAANAGKRLRDHLSHLVVHGTLHLLGFNHLSDHEAERMEHLEATALATLNIADPYGLGTRESLDHE